jgi:DNA-binding MarR family transcriptional regulator
MFFDQFLTTARVMQRAAEAEMMRHRGIVLSEYQTMQQLDAEPGRRMRLQDLAAARALSPSAITRIIDRLETRGLIQRERPDDDLRGRYAVLTASGRDWLEQRELAYAASVREALNSVDRCSVRTLTDVARRLLP